MTGPDRSGVATPHKALLILLTLVVYVLGISSDASGQSTGDAGEHRSSLIRSPLNSARYNFAAQTPGVILTGGAEATVRLAPCPSGVAGADKNHYLYISGGSSKTVSLSIATNTTPASLVTASPIYPVTGNLAVITGANNPRMNGPWKITAVNSTTFTLDNSVAGSPITNATNTAPIVIDTRALNQDNGWQTGDTVTISGVRGNTAANGRFTITRIGGHEFSLDGSIGNGAYISAGTATVTGGHASTGTATIGPEAVLITGGTCRSGAAAGTIVFTPANSHRGAWTLRSATAGIQEAIGAAQASGITHVYIPGNAVPHQIYAAITVPSNFLIEGAGGGTVLKLNAAAPAVTIFQVSGTTGVATTSATPLSFANRASTQTGTIVLTSSAGFSPGDLVLINSGTEPAYGNTFLQLDTIGAISGSLVTFDNPIVIPIDITLANSITKIVPATSVTLRYLTLDGASTGADRNGANTGLYGIALSNVSNCVIDHIWFKNFTADGALVTFGGYGNHFTDLFDTNSGSDSIYGLAFIAQTNTQINRIISTNSFGFAVGIGRSTNLNVSGLTITHAAGRGIKLSGLAWSNLQHIIVENSGFTGYAIAQGTYRTQTRDILSIGNKAGEGVWFSSQDNQYNLLDGVTVTGNAGAGVMIWPNDHHNVVRNVGGGDSFGDVGARNTLTPAAQFRCLAYNSSDQPIPAETATPLTFDANAYDIGGIHSIVTQKSRFTIPAADGQSDIPTAQYLIAAQVQFASDGTGTRLLSVWRNGSGPVCSQTSVPASSGNHSVSLSCTVALLPDDYIEFKVFQDTSGSLNVLGGANRTFGSVVRMQ